MSRVALVHGFTQTPASWAKVAAALAADHDVVSPDAPVADLWSAADELATHGPAIYVGYSMGGRMALHVALAHPQQVTALVLVSATAGIDDEGDRAARRAADDALAERIQAIGPAAFIDEWLARPLFDDLPLDAQGRATRSTDVATLTAHLRLAGTGTQTPLWSRLGELTMPVLVVAGEHDTKFVAEGERLVAAIPDAELAVLTDAGHALPFERPDDFVAVLRRWLR